MSEQSADAVLERRDDHFVGRFRAMASPCEVLMDLDDEPTARRVLETARAEALRVERKFSRYRDDNIVHRINRSRGRPVEVDAETAGLLDYAARCHALSDGMFDVTSGVLREAWRFDGSDRLPSPEVVARLRKRIGWGKVRWQRPRISLPAGMEIDLGGIGKEYAVDRATALVRGQTPASVLLNFGGDLTVTGARRGGGGWIVGLEDSGRVTPDLASGGAATSRTEIEMLRGGIATSGDTRRYLLKDGVRYGHILDPRSGWPVRGAPRSVTVAAGTCTEAGILATLAMLHGREAEAFLEAQGVRFWCQR